MTQHTPGPWRVDPDEECCVQVTLAEHWVCPIEYGDYTGLEDYEVKALEEWLSDYPRAVFQWGESSEFARDAITDLMAQCVECRIYMRSDDETEM